jgi:hypothetical protein
VKRLGAAPRGRPPDIRAPVGTSDPEAHANTASSAARGSSPGKLILPDAQLALAALAVAAGARAAALEREVMNDEKETSRVRGSPELLDDEAKTDLSALG